MYHFFAEIFIEKEFGVYKKYDYHGVVKIKIEDKEDYIKLMDIISREICYKKGIGIEKIYDIVVKSLTKL